MNFSGVELVLISDNFLTIKKEKSASWDSLKPLVISHINDYFEKNDKPVLKENLEESKLNEDETVSKIKDVLTPKLDQQ